MHRKTIFSVMLVFLVTSMLAVAFKIQTVKADGTITINADGSINPLTAPILSVDNITYTFTGNINYPTYNGIDVERSNIVIDGDGHTVEGDYSNSGLIVGLRLSEISNVTIESTYIEGFYDGIYLSYSSNIIISGNNATANSHDGFFLNSSSNITVNGNNATANGAYNIDLYCSSGNIVNGNNVTGTTTINDDGIALDNSSFNSVSGNKVTANYDGIYLTSLSSSNTVSGNNVTANRNYGILLEYVSNITVSGNSLTANGKYGIYLKSASYDNRIYHNNLINNELQGGISNSMSVWDYGYPSGGNYWSDYNGTDLYSGPYQNVTGSDAIGDTPYVIDANNIDHYPLMKPWYQISGDINFDGKVSLTDLIILAKAYGSKPGDPNWNPNADINDNGKVNLSDLVILAQHYGQHYP